MKMPPSFKPKPQDSSFELGKKVIHKLWAKCHRVPNHLSQEESYDVYIGIFREEVAALTQLAVAQLGRNHDHEEFVEGVRNELLKLKDRIPNSSSIIENFDELIQGDQICC